MAYSLKDEAIKIKELNEAIKKGRGKGAYGKSKIRKYQSEINRLRDEYELTFSEIVLWLKNYRKIKTSRSTVSNFYYRQKKQSGK